MTNVYHSTELNHVFLSKLRTEIQNTFNGCKTIAIKIHFGEPGNNAAFKPEQIKPITEILKSLNINYFLYDSSVDYESPRNSPETHKKIAIEKSWGNLGEIRTDDEFISVKGKNMAYQVCKSLANADGVLVISHFKGHYCSGFGGAIKNLGMGAVSKKTKNDIHSGGRPKIIGNCIQCKKCEKACPIGGITVTDKPEISKCYGCSNCIYVCPQKVFEPKLNFFDTLLAEGASIAQSKFKKKYYISYLINISEYCDCESDPKKTIAKDCGYLFGEDAVAMDKAAYDIINKKSGEDVFKKYNRKTGTEQISAAEEFGMGRQDYELIEVS